MKIKLPRLKYTSSGWYIPAFPPHYSVSMGPYKRKTDAEEARLGVQETINSPLWKMIIQEAREEENDFDRQWERRKKN